MSYYDVVHRGRTPLSGWVTQVADDAHGLFYAETAMYVHTRRRDGTRPAGLRRARLMSFSTLQLCRVVYVYDAVDGRHPPRYCYDYYYCCCCCYFGVILRL